MATLRHLIDRHLAATWVLVALALTMKIVVPVGFMPMPTTSGVAIVICTGMGPAPMAMPGAHAGDHADDHADDHRGGHDEPAKPDVPCLGAGIAATILGGADPVQVAAAVAFAVIVGLMPAATPLARRVPFLRPPLRGPPHRR